MPIYSNTARQQRKRRTTATQWPRHSTAASFPGLFRARTSYWRQSRSPTRKHVVPLRLASSTYSALRTFSTTASSRLVVPYRCASTHSPQFCINLANEQLQFYFNQHIFAYEQQEYIKEQIEIKQIAFSDNSDILNMILQRPLGMLSLLDEESRFPKASATSLVGSITIMLAHANCMHVLLCAARCTQCRAR